eukprot:snap_masked-scaffold_10-processed-gene-9.21-mRNA-1 protein AED:1.00 eAED:1.00 QI:0/-1/0/0/-1/1/1/0/373
MDEQSSRQRIKGAFFFLFIWVLFLTVSLIAPLEINLKEEIPFNSTARCDNYTLTEDDKIILNSLVIDPANKEIDLFRKDNSFFFPDFAFQCNYNLAQNPKKTTLKIETTNYLELQKHTFRALEGEKIGPWMKYIDRIWLHAYYNISFYGETFAPDIFPEPQNAKLEITADHLKDIHIVTTSTITIPFLRFELTELHSFEAPEEVQIAAVFEKFKDFDMRSFKIRSIALFSDEPIQKNLFPNLIQLTLVQKSSSKFSFPYQVFREIKNLKYVKLLRDVQIPKYEGKMFTSQITYLTVDVSSQDCLPDGFLQIFSNIRRLEIRGVIYKECEDSFKDRMGLKRRNYEVIFSTTYEISYCTSSVIHTGDSPQYCKVR